MKNADAAIPSQGELSFLSRYTAEVWVSAVAKFFCKPTECYGGRKRDFCDFSRYFLLLKRQHARLYGPNKNRARTQKLSGTSAGLLIDSCARTRASRTFDRVKKNNLRNNIKKFRNNVMALSELCQCRIGMML